MKMKYLREISVAGQAKKPTEQAKWFTVSRENILWMNLFDTCYLTYLIHE